jgi:hypothetical protein
MGTGSVRRQRERQRGMKLTHSIAAFRPGRRAWLLGGLVTVLVALLVTAGLTSLAWGDSLRDDGRLLPGTIIATVEVGDTTKDEALAAVEAHLEPRLDRSVALVHGDRRWETTARELGASSDAAAIVEEAFERTADVGLADLARMRWAGAAVGPELDVSVGVPDDAIEAFVAAAVDEVDRDPRDAEVAWEADGFEVTDHRDGREVDADAAVAALGEALDGDDDATVELDVERVAPEIDAEMARQAADRVGPAVDAALDHAVTVTAEGEAWTTTPRDLDATPVFESALAAALEGADATDEVRASVSDEAMGAFLASVAGGIDAAPRDAQLEFSGGDLDITPERDGRAVDRDAARDDLARALRGDDDRVELTLRRVEASVKASSFDRVLVLRQDKRRLLLYEGREVARKWPVAVGQGGSPTPTGTFTVGAKRHEPTWHNPSPDGWGSDMPSSIGPGPDNPLGVRALNWNDNGRDTLIRFHGTPNEDSIGEAASQGCVRMYNDDVIELYDLVPSGTTIISMS